MLLDQNNWNFNPLEKYQDATAELKQIGQDQQKVGTRIMNCLWEVWRFRLYQIVGEYNDFVAYAHGELVESYDRGDYLMDFVYVTERVFDWVSKNRVLHPETKQRVTVESLIDAPKMIGKLIMMSQAWPLANDEQRSQFITTALTPKKTREDIKDLRDDVVGGKVKTTYPVWEQILPEGRTIYHAYALTSDIATLIRDSLGKAAQLQQSEPIPW